MASDWNSSISTNTNDNGGLCSPTFFQKTVCLNCWWLIKSEDESNGKRLAVGGLTSREKGPVRSFSSAPLVKRHDIFTMETADGICVTLRGFINKSRTIENGFPEEVFKHFVFGFPPNWEHYAVNCFESDFSISDVLKEDASPNKSASPLIISNQGTDQNLGCKSESIKFSNLLVEKPVTPTRRHNLSEKHGSEQNNDANRGRNYDDTVTLGDEEFKNSSIVPMSPTSPVNTKQKTNTKIHPSSLKKPKKKLNLNTPATPCTREIKVQKCIVSPECMSYGRSRSGRLLMPMLEFWRNQLPVYDSDRRLTGIQDCIRPSESRTGSQSEPQKKPKKPSVLN